MSRYPTSPALSSELAPEPRCPHAPTYALRGPLGRSGIPECCLLQPRLTRQRRNSCAPGLGFHSATHGGGALGEASGRCEAQRRARPPR